MQRYFEDRLGKNVDLVIPDALSKYIREKVLGQAEYNESFLNEKWVGEGERYMEE